MGLFSDRLVNIGYIIGDVRAEIALAMHILHERPPFPHFDSDKCTRRFYLFKIQ